MAKQFDYVVTIGADASNVAKAIMDSFKNAAVQVQNERITISNIGIDDKGIVQKFLTLIKKQFANRGLELPFDYSQVNAALIELDKLEKHAKSFNKTEIKPSINLSELEKATKYTQKENEKLRQEAKKTYDLLAPQARSDQRGYGKVFNEDFVAKYKQWVIIYNELQAKMQELKATQGGMPFDKLDNDNLLKTYQLLLDIQKLQSYLPKNTLTTGNTIFDLTSSSKVLENLTSVSKLIDEVHQKLTSQISVREGNLIGLLSPIVSGYQGGAGTNLDASKSFNDATNSVNILNQKIEEENKELARANAELERYRSTLKDIQTTGDAIAKANALAVQSKNLLNAGKKDTPEYAHTNQEIGILFDYIKKTSTSFEGLSSSAKILGAREREGVLKGYQSAVNKVKEIEQRISELNTALDNERKKLEETKSAITSTTAKNKVAKGTATLPSTSQSNTTNVSPKIDPTTLKTEAKQVNVPVTVVPKIENPAQFISDAEKQLVGHSIKVPVQTQNVLANTSTVEGAQSLKSSVDSEINDLTRLQAKVGEVAKSIDDKTRRIEIEKQQMKQAVDGETFNLDRLQNKIVEVGTAIDNKTEKIRTGESQVKSSVINEVNEFSKLQAKINETTTETISSVPVGIKPSFQPDEFIAEANQILSGKKVGVGIELQSFQSTDPNASVLTGKIPGKVDIEVNLLPGTTDSVITDLKTKIGTGVIEADYKWLIDLRDNITIVESKLRSVSELAVGLKSIDMSGFTKGNNLLQIDLGDPSSLQQVSNFLTRIKTVFANNEHISQDLEVLVKVLRSLSRIDLSKLNTKDIQFTKFTKAAERSEELNKFAMALEKIANLLPSLRELTSIGNVFESFKVGASTPEKFVNFAIALGELRKELDLFDDNSRATLQYIKELTAQAEALKNLKSITKSATGKGNIVNKDKEAIKSSDALYKSAERYYDLINKSLNTNLTRNESKELDKIRQSYRDAQKAVEEYNQAVATGAKPSEEAIKAQAQAMNEFAKSQQTYLANYQNSIVSSIQGHIDQSKGKYIDEYRIKLQELLEQVKQFNYMDINLLDQNDIEKFQRFNALIVDSISRWRSDPSLLLPNSDQINNLNGNIVAWAEKNKTAARKFRKELEYIQHQLHNVNNQAQLNGLVEQFNTLRKKAQLAGVTGISFLDKLKKRFVDLFTYLASFASFYRIIGMLRRALTTVKELDDALTEMRKVSDDSLKTLKEYQRISFDLANTVGTTSAELQKSTADWLRLGEAMDDAKESALTTTKLLNVSEFENVDDATDALVAMSQAYKELDKNEIVDVLNNIGNNFSISTDGLATGLQKSAAALKVAGNDMYEAAALITAGNAIVQDADMVGSGVRTIALRLQGTKLAKQELEELGEDVDDFVVQTQSKIDEQVRAFTAVTSNELKGVSLLDENGNMRSTYEILRDIAEIYDEIVESDKANGTNKLQGLLELIAGKNRSNIAASIIQNIELLESVYTAAQDSLGSSDEELAKYLDSVTGKIAKFKNQAQELASVTFKSEFVKDFIDAGTGLLDILTKLIDKMGVLGFGGAVAGGVGIFSLIKNLDYPELRGIKIA